MQRSQYIFAAIVVFVRSIKQPDYWGVMLEKKSVYDYDFVLLFKLSKLRRPSFIAILTKYTIITRLCGV